VTVEFRLLGPVGIWVDGVSVPVGPAQVRAVLAMLLVNNGRPVSIGALIDGLWPDDPPRNARDTLGHHINSIRQALDRAGGDRAWLPSASGGAYRLTVDPASVDLHRVETLLASARTVEEIREVLTYWHDTPLAGIDTEWAERHRTAIESRYLSAWCELLEMELTADHSGSVLNDVDRLRARYPGNETLIELRMRALAVVGRRTEIGPFYRQVRGRLIEEFGHTPSQLDSVVQRLLAEDVEPAPRVTAGDIVPRQLPGSIPNFVGRATELDIMTERLDLISNDDGSMVITSIGGTAGVGKTALAIHWARRHSKRFPDGQLYVNLRGFDPSGLPMATSEAVRGFLDAFNVPAERVPADLDAQVALYRSLVEGRRLLIVLDNARDTRQVRPLLPGSSTCMVIVTSRQNLNSLIVRENARHITLEVLTGVEARELLKRFLGENRVQGEPTAVDELIERCGGLPIALGIAAARATESPHLPIGTLLDGLREEHRRLATLSTIDGQDTDIRAVFSWSYTAVSADAARLFRLLGVHPGPDLTVPAAASLIARTEREARQLLTELTQANLLVHHLPNRYRLHHLLRVYANERAEADERDAAIQRVLDHYLHTAHAATLVVEPHWDAFPLSPPADGVAPERCENREQALEWFRSERPVLIAVTRLAESRGVVPYAWQLPWAFATFLRWHGFWHDWRDTQHIALTAARRAGDKAAQARAHRIFGNACGRLGDHDQARAHHVWALTLYAELDDKTGQAHTHLDIARMQELQGHYPDALSHAQQAVDLCRAAGDSNWQAAALNSLGFYHAFAGEHQEALGHCTEALALSREVGNRLTEANTLDSIGFASHGLGDYPAAITHYGLAIDIWRELGHRHGEAETSCRLGDTYQAVNDLAAARSTWQHSFAIYQELGHSAAADVLTKIDALDSGF
jgi:DNA-binding SARP family transcriptional activator/tetratricopeptide (TPR) repeat protein